VLGGALVTGCLGILYRLVWAPWPGVHRPGHWPGWGPWGNGRRYDSLCIRSKSYGLRDHIFEMLHFRHGHFDHVFWDPSESDHFLTMLFWDPSESDDFLTMLFF
jgi:hypothetical protein